MPLIPYVIEKSGREERVYDIYSRLLKDRIVFMGTAINDEVANAIIAQLLFLQSDDPKADIHLYVNSPGGSVSAGLGIYDTMQFATWPRTASAKPPPWARSCWPPVPRGSDMHSPTPGS
jgi:ATP-dependent Clp protease, protease subunit